MNFSTLSTVRLLWSPGLARVLWAGGNWLVTIYFTLEKESSLLYACICDLVDLYSIGFSQESTAPVLQPITNVLILRILWVWASASLDGCGVAFPLAIPTSICRSKVLAFRRTRQPCPQSRSWPKDELRSRQASIGQMAGLTNNRNSRELRGTSALVWTFVCSRVLLGQELP